MVSCDTNILLYACDETCKAHNSAYTFMQEMSENKDFVICDLVLVELYRLIRNPAVLQNPYSAQEATDYCISLRTNPYWQIVEYTQGAMTDVWTNAHTCKKSHQIFDLRLGFTLKNHGVTEFATRNTKDFKQIGFTKLINPIDDQNG